MVLSAMCDKWAQDKINIAYRALETCIATTKQRETVQPYFELRYTGDLSDMTFQCPKPVRPEPIWATNLCDNTVEHVGTISKSGIVTIESSCLYTTRTDEFTFCDETRWVDWCGERCWEFTDYYCEYACPKTTYTNCLWTGSARQYKCRNDMAEACRDQWQCDTMDLSIAYKNACCPEISACLYMCLSCKSCEYGNWCLPYPCFIECTFHDVDHNQISSLAYIYCAPDGTYVCTCCANSYFCTIICNTASQSCTYECACSGCYIGWNELPYCYGNECNTAICSIVSYCYLGMICRLVDVYNVEKIVEKNTRPLYNINMKIIKG